MVKILGALCAVGLLATVGVANADGIFQIGPQIGYSDFVVDSSSSGLSYKSSMKGAALGLVARYTVPIGTDGIFAGIQAGVAKEFASDKTASSSGRINVTGESSADWSADIMPRIGYKMGDVSLSLAAGLSFVRGQGKGTASDGVTMLPFEDTQWHAGWKIAPSIDFQMTENVTLVVQAHYARYKSETYSAAGISVKAEPEMRGVRTGLLFNF